MNTKNEAMKMVLEALEGADIIDCDMRDAIVVIKKVLAQPEQEPETLFPSLAYFRHIRCTHIFIDL